MDQNTLPDPEHIVWYKAIIGFLSLLVVGFIGRIWLKHERDGELKDGSFQRRSDDYAKEIVEIKIRLTKLEARETVTKSDLHEIVSNVLDEVTRRFQADHTAIVERVEGCAQTINGRMDNLLIALSKQDDRS